MIMTDTLFEIVTEDYIEDLNKEWLNNFFSKPFIWLNQEYLFSCVKGVNDYNRDGALGVFGRQLKNFYDYFIVETGMVTEDELTNVIKIMILEKIFLTRENAEKVIRHIEQGFYREYIDGKEVELEENVNLDEVSVTQQIIDDVDWGDL